MTKGLLSVIFLAKNNKGLFNDYLYFVTNRMNVKEEMGKDNSDVVGKHLIECEQCRNSYIDFMAIMFDSDEFVFDEDDNDDDDLFLEIDYIPEKLSRKIKQDCADK